jgi:hypothetical protein
LIEENTECIRKYYAHTTGSHYLAIAVDSCAAVTLRPPHNIFQVAGNNKWPPQYAISRFDQYQLFWEQAFVPLRQSS